MRYVVALALTTLLAAPAAAEPLSFTQAETLALAHGPGLEPARLEVDAARAEAVSAGRLPDPGLSFGVENFPVTGPAAGRFGAEPMTMQTLGVSQAVPSGAKLRAERARAHSDIGVAEARTSVARREAKTAAALAWIDLYFAERRLAALDHALATLEPLWDGAAAGVTSGASRPAQALDPLQLKAALQDRRSMLAAEVGRARSSLALWTGDGQAEVSGEPPEFAMDAAALRAGLERHPTLLALTAVEQRAEADADLARAQKRPDWSFEVAYGRRDPAFGDMVSARATLSLPLFATHRQDPTVRARLADVTRASVERAEAYRTLQAKLEADLADHSAHEEQWMRARDVLLPLAQKRADLETASYGAGRARLDEVLSALSARAQAELDFLDREAAMARDGARIALTYGSDDQ